MAATGIAPNLSSPAAIGASPAAYPRRVRARVVTQALFVLTDFALLWLSAAAALCCRFLLGEGGARGVMATNAGFLLLFSVVVVLFAHTQKLYRGIEARSPLQEAAAVVKAVALASLVLAASLFLSRALVVSRLALGGTVVLSAAALVAWRYARRCRRAARVAAGTGQ